MDLPVAAVIEESTRGGNSAISEISETVVLSEKSDVSEASVLTSLELRLRGDGESAGRQSRSFSQAVWHNFLRRMVGRGPPGFGLASGTASG